MSIRQVEAVHALGTRFTEIDGDVNTFFGMTSALTRFSQLSKWTEQRVEIDRAAAQLFVKLAA